MFTECWHVIYDSPRIGTPSGSRSEYLKFMTVADSLSCTVSCGRLHFVSLYGRGIEGGVLLGGVEVFPGIPVAVCARIWEGGCR